MYLRYATLKGDVSEAFVNVIVCRFLGSPVATGMHSGQFPQYFCAPKFYCAQKNLF